METSAIVRVHAAENGGNNGCGQNGWHGLSFVRSGEARHIARTSASEPAQPDLDWYPQALAYQVELNQQLQGQLDAEQNMVAMLRAQLDQTRKEALTDPLTGLLNRRGFDQCLSRLWQKSDESRLAVLLLDIDHFKRINHTYGYVGGDSVICWLAETLRQCLRGDDSAFRFSGERFLVLMQDRSLSEAARIAEVIRARVERNRLTSYRNRSESLTVSIGVAARKGQDDPLILFERADRALCMAKQGGRNRVMREVCLN